MTIIIAAKYDQGIIVGYDTVLFGLDDENPNDRRYKIVGYKHKFRQIGNFSVGMGMIGLMDFIAFSKLEERIKEEGDVIEGIKKFVDSNQEDWTHLRFFPDAHTSYLFVAHNKIYTGSNSDLFDKMQNRDHAAIGTRDSSVINFLKRKHAMSCTFDETLHLVNAGMEIAKKECEKDKSYIYGFRVQGRGIVDIKNGKFNLLEFTEQ